MPEWGVVMPVVDIEELASSGPRMFVTGWRVTSWDGTTETSVHVPVHKGYPDVVIDEDARADWIRHHKDIVDSIHWAMKVWAVAHRTNWPREEGDVYGVDIYYQGIYATRMLAYYRGRYGELISRCRFRNSAIDESDDLSDAAWHSGSEVWGQTYPSLNTLAKHRRRAVIAESKDEFLWELVFAWPEAEWHFRWGLFLDALRDERWGSEWARVGECLAASGWAPAPIGNTSHSAPLQIDFRPAVQRLTEYADGLVEHIVAANGIPSGIMNNEVQR